MKKNKWIWLGLDCVWVILLLAFDQYTKRLAVRLLKDQAPIVIWKNVFQLEYLENRGSAFGLFQNRKIFLLVVGFLFMGFVLYLLVKLPTKKRFLALHVLLGCLMAGGIGNMIDRFVQGYVVDFFYFIFIHFPIFNVADIYIVVAAFVIAFLFFFVYRDEEMDFWMIRSDSSGKDSKGKV